MTTSANSTAFASKASRRTSTSVQLTHIGVQGDLDRRGIDVVGALCGVHVLQRVQVGVVTQGPAEVLNDGSAYDALLERIMANVGAALRNGVLDSPNAWETP